MIMDISYTGTLTVTPEYEGEVFDHDEEVERAFDATMEELGHLGVTDPCVSGSVTTGDLEITLTATGESLPEIVTEVDGKIRSALHAAGVITKGWPRPGRLGLDFHRFEADEADEIDNANDATEAAYS